MSTTTAIVLDRKGRAKEGKEAMLDIRITSNRRHVYMSTGIKVRKSEWIAGQVVNRLDAKSLNERLAIIYEKVGRAVNEAIAADRQIDVKRHPKAGVGRDRGAERQTCSARLDTQADTAARHRRGDTQALLPLGEPTGGVGTDADVGGRDHGESV